jgi:hypothetical protein
MGVPKVDAVDLTENDHSEGPGPVHPHVWFCPRRPAQRRDVSSWPIAAQGGCHNMSAAGESCSRSLSVGQPTETCFSRVARDHRRSLEPDWGLPERPADAPEPVGLPESPLA